MSVDDRAAILLAMLAMVLGGALVGSAAGALFLLEGRIAGVSGILAGALDPAVRGRSWRWLFVAGLVVGGLIADAILPGAVPGAYAGSTVRLAAAGGLVGIGARLANGCTSGHALCGVSRGSVRSVAAAATFVASGLVTVLAVRALGGGGR